MIERVVLFYLKEKEMDTDDDMTREEQELFLSKILSSMGENEITQSIQALWDEDLKSLYDIVTAENTEQRDSQLHDFILQIHTRSKDLSQKTQQFIQTQTQVLSETEQQQAEQEADDLLDTI